MADLLEEPNSFPRSSVGTAGREMHQSHLSLSVFSPFSLHPSSAIIGSFGL